MVACYGDDFQATRCHDFTAGGSVLTYGHTAQGADSMRVRASRASLRRWDCSMGRPTRWRLGSFGEVAVDLVARPLERAVRMARDELHSGLAPPVLVVERL